MRKSLTHASSLARPAIAVAVASAMAILASNAAMAQTETATPSATQDKDATTTVMVVGTRKAVASAIDRKIRNATVSDSIVAEDINQFPDKNVGEALSRITGVQLTRDFGEGSQVSIRGVAPDLNRIEINGMSVLGTNGNAGRGAELRELASELIASIDVYKGTTADLTEGGVGGTVLIRTRKPLDFKEMTIAATVAGEHSTSRGGVQPRPSLLWVDKFMDGRLGLMANIVYDKVFTQNDYSRNTSWRFLRDWDFSPEKTVTSLDPAVAAIGTVAGCSASTLTAAQKTACQQQWYDYNPGTSRYGIWTRDHKRTSAELTAQYKFSNELNAFVSYQRNDQDQRLNDRNYGTDFSALTRLSSAGIAPVYNPATGVPNTGTGTCTALPATTPSGMVVSNHVVTEYTVGDCLYIGGTGGQGAFSTSARDFKLKIGSDYLSTGFNFKRGDLEVEGLLNSSKSKYHNETNSIVLTQNAPGLKVQLDAQGLPHFTFPAGYSPDDPNSYVQAQLQYRPYETKNTEDQAKLDFKYRLSTPFFSKLWFGAQGRRSDSQRYDGGGYMVSNNGTAITSDDIYVPSANVNSTILFDPFNTTGKLRGSSVPGYPNFYYNDKYVSKTDMAALIAAVAGRTPGTFFGGYDGVSNVPSGWMTPVYNNALQYFDTSHFNFDSVYSATGNDSKVYPQIPTFKVKEEIRSAYMRADFDTELFDRNLWGNIGVRYTGTRNTSTGLNKLTVRTPTGNGTAYTDTVISNGIVSVDSKYHDYLPSANVMMWLIPDQFMLRLGWGKVMARPAIDKLVPAASCILGSGSNLVGGDGTDDCTAGNPDLKPYRATNKDLSLEYYPSADTQLTAGFFRKEIDSYIVDKALRKNVDLFHNGLGFDVTGPMNGQGATTNGVELTWRQALTFLPGYARGLGLDMNYTRMNYKYAPGTALINPLDGTELTYPGLSKNSYNAAVWYDLGDVNARIAYNYRDRFYTGGADVAGNPVFQQKTGYLDAKLQWRYNKNITISLEGKNLTDQAQTTDGGTAFRVNEVAWSGRRYFLSVSVKN
ncbi:TonB-dependent receptor [Duganella sp. sic0402]|uniref:TonB-dependent receptor n=1 Tax=Duganella sp. sic0402 TaxID=2854786 RepID=UPI001C43A4DC|nr:TonB-dependent receptor [Duganella sp. sic0402]MBV7536325.1 TonB-dependent receptor [Duganella sp. sic0402]